MSAEHRGNGAVYLRGKTWWARYHFRGHLFRETSGSAQRADAVKLLRRRLAEMGTGRTPGPDAERVTFEDLARMLTDDYVTNERPSLERVRSSLKHLREHFGLSRALDITSDRLTAYVGKRRAEGAALATIGNELAALRRGFSLAIRAGHLTHRPVFPVLSIQNARQGFFERAEFEKVREQLPAPLRPVVTFAYLTGWRKREILNLRWRDVDFTAGMIRLEPGTTKNKRGREFPFAALPELASLMQTQRDATTDLECRTAELVPWVFHRAGKRIRSYDVAWRAACERAKVPGRLMHDFRRTAVRALERAGVSRSVSMALTGHLTESIFRRYAIVAEADLREGVSKLAAQAARPASPSNVLDFPPTGTNG